MDWTKLADQKSIDAASAALKAKGFNVIVVDNKKAALDTVVKMIPEGADVMTAGSTTLNQIGFTDLLKSGAHKWVNLKDRIMAEKDPAKQHALRIQATSASHIIGSVHAVTESGEVMTASASGSQLPGYAFSSQNVIWVVSTAKIVKDFNAGLQRIREQSVPLEDKRMKDAGMGGTVLAKLLIQFVEPPFMQRKVTLIFVKEQLGF